MIEPFTLSPKERLRRARALERDYEAFLAPGERLLVHAEHTPEFVYAQLILERADRLLRLDLEAAFMTQDAPELPPAAEALELLMEHLRLQLYEYFRSDRTERFHADWRVYPVQGYMLRARGAQSSPGLEASADALLESSGLTFD